MESNNIEGKIIAAAREIFIEKGYDGVKMCDIAARAGINRPTLYYYYRTKDKIFRAVFLSIVSTFIPKIQDTINDGALSVEDKIEKVIDIYIGVIKANPYIPLFMIREVNRNAEGFMEEVRPIYIENFLDKIGADLQQQMQLGNIKQVPLRIVFTTFYGLMVFPFLSKDFVSMATGLTADEFLEEWHPYFVDQMKHLLCK